MAKKETTKKETNEKAKATKKAAYEAKVKPKQKKAENEGKRFIPPASYRKRVLRDVMGNEIPSRSMARAMEKNGFNDVESYRKHRNAKKKQLAKKRRVNNVVKTK